MPYCTSKEDAQRNELSGSIRLLYEDIEETFQFRTCHCPVTRYLTDTVLRIAGILIVDKFDFDNLADLLTAGWSAHSTTSAALRIQALLHETHSPMPCCDGAEIV